MAGTKNGEGKSSRKWRSTHRFKGGGVYWRTEQDYLDWKADMNAKRRAKTVEMRLTTPKQSTAPKNPRMKGQGVSSTKQTAEHTIYRWGRWWRTEADYQAFRNKQIIKKRADRNEVSPERQMQIEREARAAILAAQNREEQIRHEFMRLKEKHGLPKRATRVMLQNVYARTLDPEIKQFLHLESIAQMKAEERLLAIRELFLSGAKPQDILYRTALMVGINVKAKQ